MSEVIIPENSVNVLGLVFGLLFSIMAIIGIITGCYFWGKYKDNNGSFAPKGNNMFLGNTGYNTGMNQFNNQQLHLNNQQPNLYNNQAFQLNNSGGSGSYAQPNTTTSSNPWANNQLPTIKMGGNFQQAPSHGNNMQLTQRSVDSGVGGSHNSHDRWLDWSKKMAQGL